MSVLLPLSNFILFSYFLCLFAETANNNNMSGLFFDEDGDDESYGAAEEAEEADEDEEEELTAEDDKIGHSENSDLKSQAATPIGKVMGAFAQMEIGGPPKMIAVVDGGSTPYPTMHSEWNSDRQQRLSVAINLPSGTKAEDLIPRIVSDGDELEITKKWSKQLFKLDRILNKRSSNLSPLLAMLSIRMHTWMMTIIPSILYRWQLGSRSAPISSKSHRTVMVTPVLRLFTG